ncbi:hypothetical protein F4818DRAFT_77682 [Hypoxylon cercidicola]|nr:hypothetical protein F4818DRAFT_77682 [Hypoxylon cercidicola]
MPILLTICLKQAALLSVVPSLEPRYVKKHMQGFGELARYGHLSNVDASIGPLASYDDTAISRTWQEDCQGPRISQFSYEASTVACTDVLSLGFHRQGLLRRPDTRTYMLEILDLGRGKSRQRGDRNADPFIIIDNTCT